MQQQTQDFLLRTNMKNITEASTMRDLGVSSKDVTKLYKHSYMGVKHDLEFEPITTKSQARSKMKNGYFLVAINDGQVAMIYSKIKRHGAGSYYYVTTPEGESQVSTLQDVIANLPGKGWKYHASTERYTPLRQGEKRSEDQVRKIKDWKKRDAFIDTLERVHGPKLRKEATQYAEDIKQVLIAFATSDEDLNKSERYSMRGDDKNRDHMIDLRKAMQNLRGVANSDNPHNELSDKGITTEIEDHLSNGEKGHYWGSRNTDNAEKWMRNAKLGTAKVAQLFLRELRGYRDEVIDAAKGDRASKTKKRSLGKVKKAWESYKKTGEVRVLSEKV